MLGPDLTNHSSCPKGGTDHVVATGDGRLNLSKINTFRSPNPPSEMDS